MVGRDDERKKKYKDGGGIGLEEDHHGSLLLFLPAVSQVKDVGDLVFEICNSLCFLVSPITNVPGTCSHDQK